MVKFFFFPIIFLLGLLYLIWPHKSALLSPVTTPSVSTPTPAPVVTLGLVGDLGLGRNITATARAKNDFGWSFAKTTSWLTQNDFNLANLESPIIASCPTGKTGTFTFCGDTNFLPYLSENKFVLNLANNHILNYGQSGLEETHSFLQNYHLLYTPDFTTTTINGIKFGFLGADFISHPDLSPSALIAATKQYAPTVDWLIVSLHWGNEYLPKPETWRVTLAHQLIDAGADIIHGHHPHVWQGYEIYHDRPIFYSFGNFIFDQSWSYATSHSQIARLVLTKTEIENLTLFPIAINFNSQPVLQ